MSKYFRKWALAIAAALVTGSGSANAAELITNGDFNSGLSGWTTFTTTTGTIGAAAVTTFDVTGAGAQNAVALKVGQTEFVADDQQGGGIYQTFTSGAGEIDVSFAFASEAPKDNVSSGLFSVLLDGQTREVYTGGGIAADTVKRGTLSFTDTVGAGAHDLEILVTRPFLTAAGTPDQYLTDISVIGPSAVPEPDSWALMLLGVGGVGAAIRFKRRQAVPASA